MLAIAVAFASLGYFTAPTMARPTMAAAERRTHSMPSGGDSSRDGAGAHDHRNGRRVFMWMWGTPQQLVADAEIAVRNNASLTDVVLECDFGIRTTCNGINRSTTPDYPRTATPCRPNGIERPDETACVQAGCCYNADDAHAPVCFNPPSLESAWRSLATTTGCDVASARLRAAGIRVWLTLEPGEASTDTFGDVERAWANGQ